MPRQRLKHPPRSGDSLVDWEFNRIIYVIENVLRFIRAKKILRDPDDRRKTLYGLLIEDKELWISVGKKRYPPARTILHEALHAIYRKFVPHHSIYSKERILWRRLTDEQKRFLRRYIPKHEAKTEPKPK